MLPSQDVGAARAPFCSSRWDLGGALIGAAALLALNMVWGGAAARPRQPGPRRLRRRSGTLGRKHRGTRPRTRHRRRTHLPRRHFPQQQPDSFDMVVDRRVKVRAAFGLRLIGSDDRRLQVLLRDVPATAVLSHGARQDASSWIVGAADLEHLHLTLADGTPDAFDIRIDVLARSDVAGVGSVARVRVVDVPGKEPASMVAAAVQRDTVVPAALAVAEPHVQKARSAPAPARTRARQSMRLRPHLPTVSATGQMAPAGSAQCRPRPSGRCGGRCRRPAGRRFRSKLPTRCREGLGGVVVGRGGAL